MNEEEERFCFTQQLDKAQLRCRESRALPIDLLLLNTDWRRCAVDAYILDDINLAFQAIEELDDTSHITSLSTFDSLVTEYVACLLDVKCVGVNMLPVDQEITDYIDSKTYEQLKELVPSVKDKQLVGDVEFWTLMEQQITHRMKILRFEAAFNSLLSRRRLLCTRCIPVADGDLLHVDTMQTASRLDPWDEVVRQFTPRYECIRLSSLGQSEHELSVPRYAAFLLMNTKWTRRNERRYDAANPPPRICQGLQIVVDMKTQPSHLTPTYKLSRAQGGNSMLTIYSAAYSPLLFQIPAAQWDFSPRHGFVFSFEHGILRLRVRFKRLF